MGQVYSAAAADAAGAETATAIGADAGATAEAPEAGGNDGATDGPGVRTIRDGAEALGGAVRYFSGAARNFCAQPSQQK